MPGSTNTSFIPKRNPTKNVRTGEKKQLFVGTFIIRIMFFASLLAAAGVYFYENKLQSDLDSEIIKLDSAVSSFKEADFARVLAIDTRITQVKDRLSHSASVVSILDAFEKSTINTTEITELSLNRIDDKTYKVSALMNTDTFDSVIFQREMLEKSDRLVVSEIDDLALRAIPPNNGLHDGESLVGASKKEGVTFKALLIVDTANIAHKVPTGNLSSVLPPSTPADPAIVSTTTGDGDVSTNSNQTGI